MTLQEFQQRYKYDPEKDQLGEGGFSRVYKANDTLMNRVVALKFYRGNWEEKYSVLGELKKVMGFRHPNLIRYYDATVLDAPSVYDSKSKFQVGILEYANAGDLNAFMRTFPEVSEIKRVVRGIFEGLDYLHERGVVHRDIKPQNILMHQENGKWISKIADFGLAKSIENQEMASAALLGTMEYMAPEQFNTVRYGIQGRLSTNVDLWALGVILYETFTGELPYGSRTDGLSHEQLMYNIMKNEVPDDINDVMEPFRTIIKRCLVKHADKRARTAKELIAILDGKEHVSNHTPSLSSTGGKPAPKSIDRTHLTPQQRKQMFLANIVFSPLVGVILFFVWRKRKPLKSSDALNVAWWSLAAWLVVLLLLVIWMIANEYGLLQEITNGAFDSSK